VVSELNPGPQSRWTHSFGKLAIFSLTGFDKLVYVDSDMLILRNLDKLFARPHMSAVVAGRSFPGDEHWRGLNSGLMVVKPQAGLYETLLDCISKIAKATQIWAIRMYCSFTIIGHSQTTLSWMKTTISL
jgi:hypothetical protein